MRKFVVLGLVLLGTSTLGAMARADGPAKGDFGPGVEEDQSSSWIARFFADDDQGPRWRVKAKRQKDRAEKERLENESAKKGARKQSGQNRTEAKKSSESDTKEASKRDQDTDAIKREQAAYLRRLAVCDQLREIALQKNDDELSHQADELQAQAWAVYSKHIVSISPGRTEGSRIASQTSVHAGESAKAGTKEEMP
jgi:hypothetical protein